MERCHVLSLFALLLEYTHFRANLRPILLVFPQLLLSVSRKKYGRLTSPRRWGWGWLSRVVINIKKPEKICLTIARNVVVRRPSINATGLPSPSRVLGHGAFV